ncbi:MAG: peptide chain release factor N(5)-glutamine methyltransferase [Puniceicoccaceae bacterium]
MLTVLEVIQKTESFFLRKGIETPRLDAELLLAHHLNCRRLELYLQFERPLGDEILASLRPAVLRRGHREPLQRILGEVPFHEVILKASPQVLIPRPETEELVEWILLSSPSPPASLLDLGCGSGAIGIALLKAWPACRVVFRDLSAASIAATRQNLALNKLEAEVSQGHWFDGLQGHFDVIVSNPPYLTDQEWEDASPEVKDFEPRESLVGGGPNGTAALEEIIEKAHTCLAPRGSLFLETGVDQHPYLCEVAKKRGFSSARSRLDLSRRPRFLHLQTP